MNKNKEILSKKYIRYIGVVLIISMMISAMTACGGNKLSNGTYERVESAAESTGSSILTMMYTGEGFTVKGKEMTLMELFTVPYSISDGKIYVTLEGLKFTGDCSIKGNTVTIDGVTYKKK